METVANVGVVLTTHDTDTGMPTRPIAYGVGNLDGTLNEFMLRAMPGATIEEMGPWASQLAHHALTPGLTVRDILDLFVETSPVYGYLITEIPGLTATSTTKDALEILLDDILAGLASSAR